MEEYLQEFYEERAAIYEYMANYTRKEAEELAYKDYQTKLKEVNNGNTSNITKQINRNTD